MTNLNNQTKPSHKTRKFFNKAKENQEQKQNPSTPVKKKTFFNKKRMEQARKNKDSLLNLLNNFPVFDTTFKNVKPLKVGIINDLVVKAEEIGCSRLELRKAIFLYTSNIAYLKALANWKKEEKVERFDLDGNAVSVVEDDIISSAKKKLIKLLNKNKPKRKFQKRNVNNTQNNKNKKFSNQSKTQKTNA